MPQQKAYVPPLLKPVKARAAAPEEPAPQAVKSEIKIPPAPALSNAIRIPTPQQVGIGGR
jgi:hypothetical protein